MSGYELGGYCDEYHTLRALLDRIDAGEVQPIPDEPPAEHYCGDLRYTFAEYPGWEIWVFNDCYSWDYIDHVITPGGARENYIEGFRL